MKSYEIWLKGGGSITGAMKEIDAIELHKAIKQQRGVFVFVDGDNDEVSLLVDQIACFACRNEKESSAKIGFEMQ